jgi:hypothetical protein
MTNTEKKALYAALSAPFTEDAIERTEGRTTGRGYDTTGIKYQYVVNRLNEVLGLGGWRTSQTITVRETTGGNGRTRHEATCELVLQLGEWGEGHFKPWAEAHATGGHTSINEADARKGAFTNGLKKAAAMLGCGKQAYEGTLDDDNVADTERPYDYRPANPSPRPMAPPPPAIRVVEPQPPAPQVQPTHPPHHDEPQGGGDTRNRLTSKQLGALQALARKLGYQNGTFRQLVKTKYGCQPEFLDRRSASDLIGKLSAQASNGGAHPTGEYGEVA